MVDDIQLPIDPIMEALMLRTSPQINRVIGNVAVNLGWGVALAAPFLTHFALSTGRHREMAASFALVQCIMIGSVALRQGFGWRAWLLAMPLATLLLRVVGPGASAQPGLIAMAALSHAALYASLLALFGSSLQPGQVPLVTALAKRLRGPLSPAIQAYTRRVTWMWCGYFTAQIAISAALLLWAPTAVWSLFVNVLDAPLLVLMFAVEFGVRRWRFPHERHISPAAIFRSFRTVGADAG